MSPPEPPVRLTCPSNDTGYARILADGVQVGYVRRTHRAWEARLFAEAENRHGGWADAPVTRPTLREMREALRERVAEKGAWWTA